MRLYLFWGLMYHIRIEKHCQVPSWLKSACRVEVKKVEQSSQVVGFAWGGWLRSNYPDIKAPIHLT